MKEVIKKLIPAGHKKRLRPVTTFYKKQRYAGSAFICPLCETKLKSFIPLDISFRSGITKDGRLHPVENFETLNIDNYLCPICGATDRARLFALFLSGKLGGEQPSEKFRFTHFAPDAEYLSNLIKKHEYVDYRTADLFMDGVDDKVDLTNMTIYEDNSVGGFLCSHILEHIPNDRQAMQELFRILKPGGFGIIMVPILLSLDETYEDTSITSPEQRKKHFGQEDHVRAYAKGDFLKRLSDTGFIIHEYGCDYFGESQLIQSGIAPESVLYVVEKPRPNAS